MIRNIAIRKWSTRKFVIQQYLFSPKEPHVPFYKPFSGIPSNITLRIRDYTQRRNVVYLEVWLIRLNSRFVITTLHTHLEQHLDTSESINVFLVFWPFSVTDIAEDTCKRWFTMQITAVCALMALMDGILMLRVYALHKKNRRVGVLLGALFSAQTVVQAVCGHLASNVPYDGFCDTLEAHSAVLYFWSYFRVGDTLISGRVDCDEAGLNAPESSRSEDRDSGWGVNYDYNRLNYPMDHNQPGFQSSRSLRLAIIHNSLDVNGNGTGHRLDPEDLTELTSDIYTYPLELQ
uniref:Uncharacterized protein n=1 Tax=Psilocybe cubensis TaxID=181762 RepID=A0A8H7XIR5_PSICU